MEEIRLDGILPDVFRGRNDLFSEVWLQDVSFRKGRSYLVEASSGAGKTSLCSFIYGSRKDYCSDVFFDGRNLRDLSEKEMDAVRRRSLGILFQDLRLFPELTALENVQIKNRLENYKTEFQIKELFSRLGLSGRMDQKVCTMSWGQQQRVALIRSLCQPFDFLILDEPVSHLDDDNSALMAGIVREEAEARGAGIIATSIGRPLPLVYDKVIAL